MNWTARKITTVSLLSAMAVIVNLFIRFPIIPAVAHFLRYEPKDVLIVIGGFIYGPMVSFIMSFICSILEMLMFGGNILDVLMNMIATCSFACLAAYTYQHRHTKRGATLGLVLGAIAMVLTMTLWNYIVTPIYFHIPRQEVVKLLLPGIIPFNIFKASANTLLTLLIYKSIVGFLRRKQLIKDYNQAKPLNAGMVMLILFCLISLILGILIYLDIL